MAAHDFRKQPRVIFFQLRDRAERIAEEPKSYMAAIVIVVAWLAGLAAVAMWLHRMAR